jgi:hypothetical protein
MRTEKWTKLYGERSIIWQDSSVLSSRCFFPNETDDTLFESGVASEERDYDSDCPTEGGGGAEIGGGRGTISYPVLAGEPHRPELARAQ